MFPMTAAAGAAAAGAANQALRAFGSIVQVEGNEFVALLERTENPLVVHATSWLFATQYQYLTSYRGLTFYARTTAPLVLPKGTELIQARHIWVPR